MTEVTKRYSCAELGTSIFAFMNILAASTFLLASLSFLVLCVHESISPMGKADGLMWGMCLGTNLLVLLVFLFAVLLYQGMYQRKPSYLLAYIIFGVIVDLTLMTLLVASRYVFINMDVEDFLREAVGEEVYEAVTYAIIGICAIHTLLLCMVSRAWYLMISTNPVNHEKLVNETD